MPSGETIEMIERGTGSRLFAAIEKILTIEKSN